ncbi:hypothetical protein [Granulibacter bethesdensis]|uniref:hypothetical protein n=1 Tax=Granulibacter bethesdensis TaxID=364410 RepID=UPI00046D58F2|nr:hypothetical protein [Granulibacter bethesdensis]
MPTLFGIGEEDLVTETERLTLTDEEACQDWACANWVYASGVVARNKPAKTKDRYNLFVIISIFLNKNLGKLTQKKIWKSNIQCGLKLIFQNVHQEKA